jgi:hypothetical protein
MEPRTLTGTSHEEFESKTQKKRLRRAAFDEVRRIPKTYLEEVYTPLPLVSATGAETAAMDGIGRRQPEPGKLPSVY